MLVKLFKLGGTSLFVMSFGLLGLCSAQSSVGAISGTVTDATGAVVSGASIEVINLNTGEKRNTSTDDKGVYSIPNLDPGTYNVTVSAQGFSSGTAKEVKISVSFTTSV